MPYICCKKYPWYVSGNTRRCIGACVCNVLLYCKWYNVNIPICLNYLNLLFAINDDHHNNTGGKTTWWIRGHLKCLVHKAWPIIDSSLRNNLFFLPPLVCSGIAWTSLVLCVSSSFIELDRCGHCGHICCFMEQWGKNLLKKKKKKRVWSDLVNNDNLLFLMKFYLRQIIQLFGLLKLTFVLCPPLLFGCLSKWS